MSSWDKVDAKIKVSFIIYGLSAPEESTLGLSFFRRILMPSQSVEKAFSKNYMAIDDKRDVKSAVDDQTIPFHSITAFVRSLYL